MADWQDNRIPFRISTLPKMIGGFFANMTVGIFNQVVGLMKWRDQQHWVKTEHEIDETIIEADMIPQKTV